MGRKKSEAGELSKSVIKALPTGFLEEAEALDGEGLKAVLVESEANIREVQQEMDADEKLQGAKEIVKDMASAYRDAIKCQRAKIAYSLHLLAGRGEI